MVAITVVSGILTLLLTTQSVAAVTQRGLAWATDNRYASALNKKPELTWYHHWQDGKVSQLSNLEYVPMYWGASKKWLWDQRVAEMKKKTPKHLLTFNEPDISSQSNMDPDYAVSVWMKEIHPWAKKGVKVGSPAVAWDLNWLDKFLKKLKQKGGHVDFICIHWYGSWKDEKSFEKFVTTAHKRFNLPIWIPELGITTASRPSTQNVQDFMQKAFSWMDSTGYVQRAAWFGCFLSSSPPDGYATGKNALFKSPYTLSSVGNWYSSSGTSKRSIDIRSLHHAIAARKAEESEDDSDAVHCDEICELRNAQLEEWAKENPFGDEEN